LLILTSFIQIKIIGDSGIIFGLGLMDFRIQDRIGLEVSHLLYSYRNYHYLQFFQPKFNLFLHQIKCLKLYFYFPTHQPYLANIAYNHLELQDLYIFHQV